MSVDIIQHYHNSRSRLLLLDYDGTLVEFEATPQEANPSSQVVQLLSALASDPANTVVIISGRAQEPLTSWIGHIPLYIVAEHGLFIKPPGRPWQATRPLDQDWKPPVRRLMESVGVDGVFIEEKTMSLVWHYNQADPDTGSQAAEGLYAELTQYDPENLKVMHGSDHVEVTASGADKGEAVDHFLEATDYDFILGAGDDVTDDDLFRALPAEAHKLRVGPNWPNSPYDGPADLRQLLQALLRHDEAPPGGLAP
jgi:trehalose 6-phosphate synthase/phosphatase